MLQVDEDLHYLPEILRVQSLNQCAADLFGQELVQGLYTCQFCSRIIELITDAYLSQCLIYDTRMLEIVIRKEVELVEKVANVDAAQGVHLREGQDAGEGQLFRRLV